MLIMKKKFTLFLVLLVAAFSTNFLSAQDCDPGDIADDLIGVTQIYCTGGVLNLATNGEEVVDPGGNYAWFFTSLAGDSIPFPAWFLGEEFSGDLNELMVANGGEAFPPGEYAAQGLSIDDGAAPSDVCLVPTENAVLFTIYEEGSPECDGLVEECQEAAPNDVCDNAETMPKPIGLGTPQSAGPYDISCGTTGGDDPDFGWECFGEPNGDNSAPSLETTVWFEFEGDGNTYHIRSSNCDGDLGVGEYISDGDTQFALYSGSCGNLTAIECNEDDPELEQGTTVYPAALTVATTAGTMYYLMVDAFNFQGTVSSGSFCLDVTMTESASGCSASVGTITAPANTDVCGANDSEQILIEGAAGGDFTTNIVITETDDLVIVALAGGSGIINFDDLGLPYADNYTAHVINYPADQEDAILNAIDFGVTTGPDIGELIADGTICAAVDFDGVPFTYSACEFPIAIEDLEGIADLSVFPMPVAGAATLQFNATEAMPVVVNVFDLSGQLIKAQNATTQFGINNISVDFADLSAGIYFLSLETASGAVTQKVVKQ